MNIWITKNLRFGYKYTISKPIRNQINSCLNDWLEDLLEQKSKKDDILIISGGLFSSTNPSLVAINDAHKFLKKIASKIKVYLINSKLDTRIFDGVDYSTLDIFSDINNLSIIKETFNIENITIIPHDYINLHDKELILDTNLFEFNGIEIPNMMQLEPNENKPGLIVFNTSNNKQIFIENTFSPKHLTYQINDMEDFISVKNNDKDFIHLEINNDLIKNNKLQVNVSLHSLNANSVKYVDIKEELSQKNININHSENIKDTIYQFIGDDINIKKQFDRVLKVLKK